MSRPEKTIIYNLFPLLAGKFTEWDKHFARASEMGFNWIFVNPLQRPGKSGSIYSIADHYEYNPLLIDAMSRKKPEDQLRDALRRGEARGLSFMIDLVISHCAVDSKLLKLHPDWFEWAAKGRVAHPSADENGKRVVWNDLAKFDYRRSKDPEGLFQYFLKFVNSLINLGFKGFRCDAAYQVPTNVWQRLIGETKKNHPEVRFVAETLGCTPDQTNSTARAGFDYILNSSKWWDFSSYWLMEQYNLTRDTVPSISFPESHDTRRLSEELGGNVEGLKQKYLFASLFSASVMIPVGFEFGFRERLHVVGTRPEDWEETGIDLRAFIKAVNSLKAQSAALQEDGPTEILRDGNSNILLMRKASTATQDEVLLILNKDFRNKQYFRAENLYQLVRSHGVPLVDVSPEYRLDYLPTPFSYDLRPGQGIVLTTSRASA